MALKERQQLSEIGVIPEDWDLVPLSSVSAFITKGATPTTYGFTWQADGIPFFRSDSITENGLDNSLSVKISDEAHKMLSRSEIRQGDLLMAITGYVGRVALYREEFSANINQHLARIRVHDDRAFAKFIYYWLSQPKVRRAFETITTGQAYPQISLRQVRDALIPCPIVPEQRAIAEVLSHLDATIAAITKLLAKKRDLRTATMQRLLTGEERLPGFSEPWRVKKLGDHVAFLKNGTHSRAQLTTDDLIRYLHYGDIHVYSDVHLDLECNDLPRLPYGEARRLSRLVDGDLVFVDASEDLNGVGKSVEVRGVDDIDLVAGQHTIAARFDKAVLADGFKAYLQHIPDLIRHLRRLAAGTKVYATNRKHIASAEILLPEPEEQRAIAEVLRDMSIEIATLQRRLSKTNALKQAMMQALLTGRVRLPLDTVEDAGMELVDA